MKKGLIGAVTSVGAFAALGMALHNITSVKNIVLPDGFTVTAHTGCEKTKDNSLDAITVGFGYGADIVEFDLNFDKNGAAVLSHDSPKNDDCVPLEEAFSLISGYKGLKANVDVKSTENLPSVIECAEKYGISDRIFFTGIEKEKVDTVKKNAEGYLYYLNTSVDGSKKNDIGYIKELVEEVKSLGACGLNINFRSCSKLMVDEFHKNGLSVSVWTVNKKSDMKKMLSLGVDNITSRKIKDLKSLLAVIGSVG